MNSWAEEIFVRSQLYFPSPRLFNDPFDCRVPSFRTISKYEFNEFLKHEVAKKFSSLSRNERRKKLHDLLSEKPFVQRVDELREFLQGQVNNLGVLSLCEVPDDILMWADYASSHAGFCLKFEASKYTRFFGYAQRVHYANDYQPILRLHDNNAMVERIILTKSPLVIRARMANHQSRVRARSADIPDRASGWGDIRLSNEEGRQGAGPCMDARAL
jgi:hypothetical protein